MRQTLCLIGLLVNGVAFAQAERYELGRKVHDLEVAWETLAPSPEAKKRATPLINQAVQSFFRFNMTGAARFLDQARHALLSPEAVPSGVTWADALSLQPETRLLDSGALEWTLTVRQFYKPEVAPPAKPMAHIRVGRGKPQEFPLDQFPTTLKVSLKDLPGLASADLPVSAAIVSEGKVLGVKTLAVSRIENLDKRLAKLREAVDAKPATPTIEHATLELLAKLLGDLAAKTIPETDYPAVKLILEAEQLADSKLEYFDVNRSGEHWLALPGKKTPTIVRLRLPEKMSRDKPVPVVFALHGMGGSENMFFDAYGNGIVPRLAHERGWIVIAPRVGGLLGTGAAPDLPAILDQLAKRYPTDSRRVFVVGHSMGAGHAMLLSQQTPERFAGIAALGGGGRVGKPESVKNLPFFIGCGKQDFALGGARLMKESLTAVNAPVRYREYEDIEHLAIVQEAARDVFAFFDKLAGKGK